MAKKKDALDTALEFIEDVDDDTAVLTFDEPEDTMEEVIGVVEETEDTLDEDDTMMSGIESLITDIDDSVENLTWLVYGKNGTGKTTLLSTVDGMLILAPEDGTLSIKDKAKDAKKLKVDTWDKMEQVYWLLKRSPRKKGGIAIKTAKGEFIVKSMGIDTVTKLAEVCMRNVILGDKEDDESHDVLTKRLKDWGDMSDKIKHWLQKFNELPIQKVWLFQEDSNSDSLDDDEYSIYPAINRSVRIYCQSEADVIARTYIAKTEKGVQFRLSAKPNPHYVTKDRTNSLTKVVANPDLSKIYNLVFGDKK